jgi:chromosome segregation protein
MHLKTLEIQGFKSFPERTVIDFHPGVTAIVGPNGSGKSNVTDAIPWGLGEQSVKTLRGARMEDVIFTGTQSRRAMSYAEVSITFDNSDRSLPWNTQSCV